MGPREKGSNQLDKSLLRRILRLQCSDGGSHDVSFEVARMSPRLNHIIREITEEFDQEPGVPPVVSVCIGDLPSDGVKYALEYCRCLHMQNSGDSSSMKKWNTRYRSFDSRLLCELASASYHFDIQSLVDQTCRSIAQVMSASDTAHELRDTFGLDDCSDGECSCVVTELRATLAGLDMDILSHFAGHSDDDEDEDDDDFMVEDSETIFKYTREPSVDELLGYINGTTQKHPSIANENAPPGGKSKKNARRKKRRQKKKKQSTKETATEGPEETPEDSSNQDLTPNETESLTEKLRLASINPSAIFDESKFEDDDADHEVESFRRALEDAHKQSVETKAKVSLQVPFFAPVDPAK